MSIGVRLPNWLGDYLLARRSLSALAARESTDAIVFAGRAPLRSLVAAEYPSARWIETAPGLAAALTLGARWREEDVRRLYLYPTSFSSRIAGLRSGATDRRGFGSRPGPHPDHGAGWGLTRAVSRSAIGRRHLEDEYVELAGLEPEATPPPPILPVPPGGHEEAATLLGRYAHEPYLVVAPGARYGPAKRWPVPSYVAAAESLVRELRVGLVLVGEAADAPVCAELAAALGDTVLSLAGRTTLAGLCGVLAGATGALANDSGTAHLAAALGRPTVVVFGSTEPRWTAPRGDHVAPLAPDLRCAPCFRRTCPLQDTYVCLRVTEPTAVVRAFARVHRRVAA